ncbi:unnamed protein product [Clonostachys chloroleuca]|uniref:Uncharacterized protein n=1 Tax=Clonostachys chloroleuca TaxID=1926264 RepID=A0AA35M812_9HYPO|nr:unnamed protein product [Clonostachys chloroleuca]
MHVIPMSILLAGFMSGINAGVVSYRDYEFGSFDTFSDDSCRNDGNRTFISKISEKGHFDGRAKSVRVEHLDDGCSFWAMTRIKPSPEIRNITKESGCVTLTPDAYIPLPWVSFCLPVEDQAAGLSEKSLLDGLE